MKPKSRGRGPRVQHAGFSKDLESRFVSFAFGALKPSDKLYPYSGYRYRKTFDLLLLTLKVPAGLFTPGGLRGGGAVTAYLEGKPIATIQWDMRLGSQETLRYYLQEVAASNSLLSLPQDARISIQAVARFYEASLLAAMEVAPHVDAPLVLRTQFRA